MVPIEKIVRLKHPGALHNLQWPADLPTFGEFNLIYGWNGSGKTTISRLLRCLEQHEVPAPGTVTLRMAGHDIDGTAFPAATTDVRVFNRDFVNDSVFPVGGGDVPPIFVVGKESVEKQKRVEALKKKKTEREANLVRAQDAHRKAEGDLDRHYVENARAIKDRLRVAGRGAYNEYDKRAYRNAIQTMRDAGDASTKQLDDATRESVRMQSEATIKPELSVVSYRLPSLEALRDEVAAVLSTTVTSAAIQTLKDDTALGSWLQEGLALHKHRESKVCMFCEQPLPAQRMAALEAHFNAEYERLVARTDQLAKQIRDASAQASQVVRPDPSTLYDDMRDEYQAAEISLHHALSGVSTFLNALVQALEDKKGSPFKALTLEALAPAVDEGVVARLNAVIQRHNEVCDDFEARTSAARDRLAQDMLAAQVGTYMALADTEKITADAIGPINADIQRLSMDIAELESQILEYRQPAEDLNEDLRRYLGHSELSLEIKDTGYRLVRNGELADSLSEGERTALAVLYFLKSLDDRRFNRSQGVVVLDDPVSSLDANALYLAFGFIRDRTRGSAQLFILTHNFVFFRQVKNWFHHMKHQGSKDVNQRPARFYMLARVEGVPSRSTALGPLDPLLEEYESEYHYLFATVYRAAHQEASGPLSNNYDLPNVARRLLEMFLAFRRPQVAGELWRKLQGVPFDEVRKVRVIRFVHTYSHGDAVGAPEHDPSVLAEAPAVLNDLLALMEAEDRGHFGAMKCIVDGSTDPAETV
jgi:wobble nucleotide-excising tRNase